MSYVKSLSGDFGGGLNPEQFRDEVNASSIIPTCEMVLNIADDVTISFDSALSAPEQTTLDGLVSSHVAIPAEKDDEHVDHTEVIVTAGTGLTGTNDIKTSTTLDLDITTLTTESTIDAATDFIAVYDTSASAHRKVLVQDLQDGVGESNTASNVGTGADIFKQKTGVDLEFRGIEAGSTKISTVVNGDNVDVDVVEANVDHDALLNFVSNEHIDHSAVTITAGTALTGGGDITTNRTIDFDLTELTAESTIDAAADQVVVYDASAGAHRKVLVQDIQSVEGEDNTASNVGAGGVGLFKQKTGVDLEFKNINAGSNKISIVDDVANDEVDVDVVEANIDHDALTNFVANEHVDHSAVNITAGIGLVGGGDITTSRTIDLDIPELTTESTIDAAADFVAVYDASATAHRKVLIQDIQGGAANTIIVQEEGTNVANTPHSALNFIGTRVTATDGGSGVADVTVAMPTTSKGDIMVHNGTDDTRLPVGIDNYLLIADSSQPTGMRWDMLNSDVIDRDLQQATATALTATTSQTFVDLDSMSLTTFNSVPNQYAVSFSGEFTVSNANRRVNTVLSVDGVDVAALNFIIGAPSSGSFTVIAFNYVHPTLIANGVEIKVRWRVAGGKATIGCLSRVLVINGLPD